MSNFKQKYYKCSVCWTNTWEDKIYTIKVKNDLKRPNKTVCKSCYDYLKD